MNYKIVNVKVGFPTNSLGKVTSKLDDCKVNYIVIVNDIEEDKKQKLAKSKIITTIGDTLNLFDIT